MILSPLLLPGRESRWKLLPVLFGDSACFYSFEIKEELRGLGLGWEALSLTLSLLLKGLPRLAADAFLSMYQGLTHLHILVPKAGFHIKESLSYYLY